MWWPWPWPLTYFKVKFVAGRGTTILEFACYIWPTAGCADHRQVAFINVPRQCTETGRSPTCIESWERIVTSLMVRMRIVSSVTSVFAIDTYCFSINMYNGIVFPLLNHSNIFEPIPDEPRSTNSSEVGQITCAVINTSNEVKSPLLPEILIYNFSRRILESFLL